jgi:hypothetical protein
MSKKIAIALPFLLFLLHACKEEKKKEEKAPIVQVPQDQLLVQLKTLEDSMNVAWTSMIQEDDLKLSYTKRLLEEVSYTKKYDVIGQAKLMEQYKALKGKRFGGQEVTDSESIDRYDAATDSLLKAVNALVSSTPNVENYPLCGELVQEITAMDNNVVLKRIAYDKWALQYNQLLEEQKESLSKLGPPSSEKKKKRLFQLEQ